jgi:hypothetical protein
LKPEEFVVADDAGALVAPAAAPAPAAPLPAVRTPDPEPEPIEPVVPPAANAGELHGAVVVVVVEAVVVDFDLDLLVVVVVDPEPDLAAAAVVVVAEVEEVVVHGTVVALPAAWATPFTSVPPPVAPR